LGKNISNILLARIIPYIDQITGDFYVMDQLPIRYSAFSIYRPRKSMIQLREKYSMASE
jgi:hypothetical protein